MKKIVASAILVTSFCVAVAQPKTAPKTVPAKQPVSVLKTLNDSASYAVGVSVANFYKQQGITKLNTTLVTRGINDIFGNKKALLDEAACNNVMNTYMSKMQSEKSKPRIDSGNNFLAKNKKQTGCKNNCQRPAVRSYY